MAKGGIGFNRKSRSFAKARPGARVRRRLRMELLEDRRMLAAMLYVDFGDLYPTTGFTGTLEALRTATSGVPGDPPVRGPVMDGTMNSDWNSANMRDADEFTLTSFASAYAAWDIDYEGGLSQLRADIMNFVRRFYEPFAIEVVELSSVPVNVNGRLVSGASSLEDVSSTLGANETLPQNNDSYVLLGSMTVHRMTATTGDFDPSTVFGGYASTANMPDSNDWDNSSLVYLRRAMFDASNVPGYFGNLIAHEAGHNFGLQHGLTAAPEGDVSPLIPTSEIMSYRSGNGFNFFSRYPMVRGNSNTSNNDDLLAVAPPAPANQVTPYDQWANLPSVGSNPTFNYITGTGAHDIITVTKAGLNALVTVEAFSDSDYATPLEVPGTGGASTVYSYFVSLDRPIVIDAGDRDDRIVLDGDLATQILVRGMSGTDELVVDAKGASNVQYIPGVYDGDGLDGLPNLQGQIIVGATTVNFQEFEVDSLVTIHDVGGAFRIGLSDLDDNVRLALDDDGLVILSGVVADATIVPIRLDRIEEVHVDGLAGNDILTVDSSMGLIESIPIHFDGGTGFDRLNLRQTGGPVRTDSTVMVGANPGDGVSLITDGGDTQTVFFQNIEPVTDNVPAATFNINSAPGIASLLDAANSINYSTGTLMGATWGRVTVDHFEPIEFTNKTELMIAAGAGSDEINLNNPSTPTGLASITINGGDPTVGDTVIVNGNSDVADDIHVNVLDERSAIVTGAQPVPVNITGAEHLLIDGLGRLDLATFDAITYITPDGPDNIVFVPGTLEGSGTFDGGGMLPVSFRYIRNFTIADASGLRRDSLQLYGTNGDDFFETDSNGEVWYSNVINNFKFLTPGVAEIAFLGVEGDDRFVIDGEGTSPPIFDRIYIEGGGSSVGDSLMYTGGGGDIYLSRFPLFFHYDPHVFWIVEDVDHPVLFRGIEVVDFGVVDADLIVTGSTVDTLTYTPVSPQIGTFEWDGFGMQSLDMTFNFAFLGDGDFIANFPTVDVVGTNGHDLFTIDSPNRVATVTDSDGTVLKPVHLAAGVATLGAQGRRGNDTFLVIPAPNNPVGPAVGPGFALPSNLVVYVDGGLPGASDALVVASPAGTPLPPDLFTVVNRGRNHGEGVVRVFQDQPGAGNEPFQWPDIVYSNVEVVTPVPFVNAQGVPNLLVLGADQYESNEFLTTAAFLGAGSVQNVVNLAISPNALEHLFVPADRDFFRVVAQHTGVIDFQVYFRNIPEFLPGAGDLDIQVRDSAGNVIAGFGVNDFALSSDGDERRRIPVVAGETYYLQVFGKTDTAFNAYHISIVNTPTPTPRDLELDDVIIASNVAAAASATNFTGAASLSATDDFYNGKYLTFTSGPLTGRRAEIVDYIGATRTFVIGPGFSASPGVGNSFEIESSDSGRSQFDNITRDATPTIFLRLDDDFLLNDLRGGAAGQLPPDSQRIPIPFRGPVADAHLPGYRVAIFAENNTQVPVFQGYADQVAGQPGVYAFTFTNPLDDGSHFITAKVQMVDPAVDFNTDYGSASAALEIVIDTQRPSVYFGNPVAADDGLDAASDSGSIARPVTFSDRITNETTPTFWGTGEANSVIRLYVDQNLNGVVDANDVLIAVTTVVPLDGTNQFLQGRWEATSNIDLNDPQYFARDGQRQILVTAEDPSGNVSDGTTLDSLRIFVDTQAPRVAGVFVTGTAFDLFDPKPSVNGPTPAVNSIDVHILDFPLRVSPDWLYNALVAEIATIPGNYMLVGDHVGQIVIEAVAIVSPVAANGAPASATVRLFFSSPLPDDRYTLSVSDNLVDPAGNQLDGESNAFAPTENPTLPSGDGVPGGNFVGRFTVDSRPEIGVVSEGLIYVDINGNSLWDPTGINHDLTNRDLVFQLGRPTDRVFAGQFTATGAAAANGFDRLGAYGRVNGVYSFAFDTDDDGVADMVSPMPSQYQVNGMPVAGNFSNAKPGDEIGLFDGTYWYLDLNGNNRIDAGERIPSNFTGLALVGDFNGDGQDDLATFDTATNTFYFDTNRDGTWDYQWNVSDDVQRFIGIPGFTAIPLAGDLNLDGIDDIGLWVKGRNGVLPRNAGETFFWVSDQRNANPANVFDAFSPAPLGNDLYTQFGDELALPVFGNFDPPVAAESAAPNPYPLHRSHDRADVNGDGHVTPLDALLVLNHLASRVELPWHNPSLTLALADGRMLDVSGDNQITPLDALLVLNEVSRRARGEGEATRSSQLGVSSIEAIDRVFDELGSGFDLEENQRKRKAKLA